jgi:uncharacterized secreted protein with C-terminal beta-propeller domain
MQKISNALLVLIVILLAFIVFQYQRSNTAPDISSQYQAVILNNGQVFFGRLENAQSQFPVLRDVFYIVSQVNPETKQVTNTLVRRGNELHGPEYMVLNRQSILLYEPVKEDSQISKFISEQKTKPNQ